VCGEREREGERKKRKYCKEEEEGADSVIYYLVAPLSY
jgi:hypothetical protein